MSPNQIREEVIDYLAGNVTIEELEDWIASQTWNVHLRAGQAAQELAYSIEAKLSEFSGGHISEESLRNELSPMVTSYVPELDVDWAVNIDTVGPANLTNFQSDQVAA